MPRLRSYGQYCGLAHALEIVGERWALLIIRDLVLGPKRFTDLRTGLPRIPTNVLSARLKELESAGVVRRRTMPRPSAAVVYELTDYGAQLEDIVLRLGRWGASTLGEPGPEDIVTPDGEVLALRATFKPEAAVGVRARYQVRVADVVVHAHVEDGTLIAGDGPLPAPDLVLEMDDISTHKPLLAGELTPEEAVAKGLVTVTGKPAEFKRFLKLFSVSTEGLPGD
ncbi:winged helix-turn-helix transcriptional regulator [Microlunatus parietis]|uniref:DNA-binding HxlR family transcriptional regulator n=1 Tax=Microlunatus parietis TaxID=682979 RepID=A0A7Y9L9D5_9ACTN|nr:helix-turn-helix domain-containing protein [Microlunatus parietis]NYE71669.1 DNA-binding HxlR family transcriptional regulator [Microlunatus parietis]